MQSPLNRRHLLRLLGLAALGIPPAARAFASDTPQLAFAPGIDLETWQKTLRQRLLQIMALPDVSAVPLDPLLQRETQTDTYTLDRIAFTAEPGQRVPGFLLLPKNAKPPFPVMICLQGHSPGMHISIGRAHNDRERQSIAGGRDLALQAVARGWAALVIEQRGFGERAVDDLKCLDASLMTLMRGRPMTGSRVLDVIRAIDFAATLPNLDTSRLASIGNSAGGTITFYAAAVDTRIRLAVVSCSFSTFADSWLSIPHCACGYLPGIAALADMPDLAGLIAPRHLLIVAGRQDPLARFQGVEQGVRQAEQIFAAANAPQRLKLLAADGGHQFYPDLAWPAIDAVARSWQN